MEGCEDGALLPIIVSGALVTVRAPLGIGDGLVEG